MSQAQAIESKEIAAIRQDYQRAALDESEAGHDPIALFRRWFDEAVHAQVAEVNAFSLSTINEAGRPSARILLLKGIEQDGFTFFTNYESRKSQHILNNANVSLLFPWYPIGAPSYRAWYRQKNC